MLIPCFVIGFVRPLLLVTLTELVLTYYCNQQSHKWNQNALFTKS